MIKKIMMCGCLLLASCVSTSSASPRVVRADINVDGAYIYYTVEVANGGSEDVVVFDNFACLCGFSVQRSPSAKDGSSGDVEAAMTFTAWSSGSSRECEFCTSMECPDRWNYIAPGTQKQFSGRVRVEHPVLEEAAKGAEISFRAKICESGGRGPISDLEIRAATILQ